MKAALGAKISGANLLKFTPTSKRVIISSLSNGNLFVDDASRKEIKQVPIGPGAVYSHGPRCRSRRYC